VPAFVAESGKLRCPRGPFSPWRPLLE
jgi:hypothetical protein